jgi:hypothetical protein
MKDETASMPIASTFRAGFRPALNGSEPDYSAAAHTLKRRFHLLRVIGEGHDRHVMNVATRR